MWERSSGCLVAVVAAALILLSTVGSGAGTVASPRTAPPQVQAAGDPLHQQGIDTDSVRLIVSVAENGSATWTVQYWTRLDDENTTDAFESLQSDIRANPENFSDRFASRMRSTVATAENATGREMNATGFAVSAETRTPPQYGVVIYTFRWKGFAAVEGDTIRVGDAIEGLFLDDRTRLVIEWPSAYTPTRIAPQPDERRSDAVVWRGAETSFVSGEPSVVLRPDAAGTTAAAGGGDGGTATASPDGGDSSLPLVGVGLLAVLIGTAVWHYRDRFGADGGQPSDAGTRPGAEAAGDDSGGGAETAAPEEGGAEAREDLLSNEERVLQFVRERGGRVKQQEIVEAFDWTEARTSQIVRDLRDDGDLEGFRLGRENVLKLPDEE
ncbi:MAG: helix-turn-helix transcriptional regulator [Haloplanus sp.]